MSNGPSLKQKIVPSTSSPTSRPYPPTAPRRDACPTLHGAAPISPDLPPRRPTQPPTAPRCPAPPGLPPRRAAPPGLPSRGAAPLGLPPRRPASHRVAPPRPSSHRNAPSRYMSHPPSAAGRGLPRLQVTDSTSSLHIGTVASPACGRLRPASSPFPTVHRLIELTGLIPFDNSSFTNVAVKQRSGPKPTIVQEKEIKASTISCSNHQLLLLLLLLVYTNSSSSRGSLEQWHAPSPPRLNHSTSILCTAWLDVQPAGSFVYVQTRCYDVQFNA
ncbi:wiskott-Aldrich syndrome protein homolog 1 isoform X2 [Triticum aestivum]|uniref:wiskott-Aldrich syndrome protein homolog 1 isoform X2 n=1 Tax=Triticum aestivum TaxID=4565 RepID=UPI001D03493C|nr:wiskott-Aldrich syndrome protein homolog 1-like isoform X2 [Triticum aestivum]